MILQFHSVNCFIDLAHFVFLTHSLGNHLHPHTVKFLAKPPLLLIDLNLQIPDLSHRIFILAYNLAAVNVHQLIHFKFVFLLQITLSLRQLFRVLLLHAFQFQRVLR